MIRDYINGYIEAQSDTKKEEVGIGGFTAFARINDSTKYSATVPNTALEDGSIASDHIVNNPITITINGNISDVYLKPDKLFELQRKAVATAGTISQYLPARTSTQIAKANALANDITSKIDAVDNLIEAGSSPSSLFGSDDDTITNIENFINILEAYYYSKTLISIEMKYRTHENMAITELSITRDNENNAQTFALTAVKVNFAALVYTDASEFFKNPSGDAGSQTDPEKDKGTQAPQTKSLLSFLGGS